MVLPLESCKLSLMKGVLSSDCSNFSYLAVYLLQADMEQTRKQRQSTNSHSQIKTSIIDPKKVESDNSESQKQKHQYVIEMAKNYPFNQPCPDNCIKFVKYTRQFRPAEYPQLRRQIQVCLQLKHPNLINIVRAFESKKNSLFELYYEYIPENIEPALCMMQKQEITEARTRLSDLCKYLILNNITPDISAKNIGFKDKNIKFFLDVHKADSKNFTNKKQMATIKQIQIRSLFTALLRKHQPQTVKNSRPSNYVKSHDTLANSTSGSFLGFTDQQPRNSSLTNFNRKSNQADTQRNILDLNKIKSIDDKIKQLKQKMNKKRKPSRQSTTPNLIFNESAVAHPAQQLQHQQSLPPNPPSNQMMRMVHQYMQAHHYNVRDGRENADSPVLQIAINRCDDQQSMDTYNQELGEEPQLPKITHQTMRQTTKSPPQLIFREKLHESVGNARFNMIKKNAITKDTLTLRDLDASLKNGSQVPQRDLVKSSSGYTGSKKYQSISEFKKSPEQSLKRSVTAVSKDTKSRRKLEEHLKEIKHIQKEISMRKLNQKKQEGKKIQQRKLTQPTSQKAPEDRIGGIMKYYNFEPDLLDQFNDILHSDSPPKIESQRRTDGINQRVKLALKKSEATLESFRQKMAWKGDANLGHSQF